MPCIYYKIKKKNNKREKRIYYYCSKSRKEISFSDCQNCLQKEYKNFKPLKKRTYKLSKNENNRFSIIYQDLSKCCICGSEIAVEINEIFEGNAYRQASIKYGLTAPMCNKTTCHKRFHSDRLFALYYKSLFQKEFENIYSHEQFMNIFKKNYIYLYEKERMKGG